MYSDVLLGNMMPVHIMHGGKRCLLLVCNNTNGTNFYWKCIVGKIKRKCGWNLSSTVSENVSKGI